MINKIKILKFFTIFPFLFGLNINSMGTANKGNIRTTIVKYEAIDGRTGSEIEVICLDPKYFKCLECSKKSSETKFIQRLNIIKHLKNTHKVKEKYKVTYDNGSILEKPIKISAPSSSSSILTTLEKPINLSTSSTSSSISTTITTKRKRSTDDGKKSIKKKCIRGKKVMALKGIYNSDNSANIKMERRKSCSGDLTPFVCNACTRNYDIVSNSKRHLKQVHKVDKIEEIPFDDSIDSHSIPLRTLTTALIAPKIHRKKQAPIKSSSALSSISSTDDKKGKEELELTDTISDNAILKVTETESDSEYIEVFNNINNSEYTLTIKELGEDKEITLLPDHKINFEKGIADFTVYLKDNKNQVVNKITFSDQKKSVTLTTQLLD